MPKKLQQKKINKKGPLRKDAERTPSPRLSEKKRATSRQKRSTTKRNRVANCLAGKRKKKKASQQTKSQVEAAESSYAVYKESLQKHLPNAKAALINPTIQPCRKGLQHSVPLIMIMIHIVSLFVTLQNTVTSACKKTAQLVGVSQEVIRKHVMLWYDKQEIRPLGEKRGQGSLHHSDSNHILKRTHLTAIKKFVDNNNQKAGGMTTIKSIRDFLQR